MDGYNEVDDYEFNFYYYGYYLLIYIAITIITTRTIITENVANIFCYVFIYFVKKS